MDLKKLFTDDDAVSPVIGVILMVAITVILAAVIASLVLGLGDEPTQTPSAQFEFDYDDSAGELTVSHNGGNTIDADEIEIRGNDDIGGTTDGAGADLQANWDDRDGDGSVVNTGSTEASTGDSLTLGVGSGYSVTVTWVPPGGGDTSPLASDEGPDA